jgi:integrase
MKLDNGAVARLTLPSGKSDAIFWDEDLIGFGLRLRASGGDKVRRSWVAQYRSKGRTRRVLIGATAKLTPAKARDAARKILAKVALGQDPQEEKAEQRLKAPHTLRAIAQDYLDAKQVRPRTLTEIKRYLTGPYFKPLHSTTIGSITRADVAARITAIGKTSGSTTANRARAALSAMFSWAMGQGLAEANPCVGANRLQENPTRERVLSNAELVAVWKACEECGTFGKVVQLLVLTGARRSEIGGMCWLELDEDKGSWSLPPERSKNGKRLTLPLPDLAWSIIGSVPRRNDVDAIFGGISKWHGFKQRLDGRLCGAVAPWRVHDLRRTTATGMADIGVAPHVIEAVLNHYAGHRAGVAGIYNRSSYAREMKAALALWADHIRSITGGGERTVVPMHRQVSDA